MNQTICPKFEHAVQILGKRWVSLIVNQLLQGPKRFSDLETEIQLSGKVLSERLKYLESEGIVLRIVETKTPIKIEYSLTPKGRSLEKIMNEISSWSNEWVKIAK